jgi:hypothetical protein
MGTNASAPTLRSKLLKLGLVLAGYVTAFLLTCAFFYVRSLLTPQDPSQASAGMQAFADLMLFLAMFGFLSLAPTGLALYFLRRAERLWTVLPFACLAFAVTGPVAAAMIPRNSTIIGFFSLPRALGAPLFCLAFLISAAIAPRRCPYWPLLVAALIEAAVSAYVCLCLFILGHWLL